MHNCRRKAFNNQVLKAHKTGKDKKIQSNHNYLILILHTYPFSIFTTIKQDMAASYWKEEREQH